MQCNPTHRTVAFLFVGRWRHGRYDIAKLDMVTAMPEFNRSKATRGLKTGAVALDPLTNTMTDEDRQAVAVKVSSNTKSEGEKAVASLSADEARAASSKEMDPGPDTDDATFPGADAGEVIASARYLARLQLN